MPGSNARPLPAQDLDHVLAHAEGVWEDLRGGRLFVTGGTGFLGRWMLESFIHANDALGLGARAMVLTRDVGRFAGSAPHLVQHPAIQPLEGEIGTFEAPEGDITHVLHMATETVLDRSLAASFLTAVEGTRRVLALASERHVQGLLLTSSGAVYGTQPPELERVGEDYTGGPRAEDAAAGYAHGKRAAEYLCAATAAETGLPVKIARGFAFVGPLLPLDANFAIGNFIRDALHGERIEVAGDGTPRRSYLYAADLAVWLWTILLRGATCRPYNVGSETDLSISDLATLVARNLNPAIPIVTKRQASPGILPARYVPSTARASRELGLQAQVGLEDAVTRTAAWYSGRTYAQRSRLG